MVENIEIEEHLVKFAEKKNNSRTPVLQNIYCDNLSYTWNLYSPTTPQMCLVISSVRL